MEGMSIREIWVDYRFLMMAVVILSFLAACFHLYWMPNVSYDPFAPFLVVKWTIEGTYFPLAALVVWILGMWRSFWKNGARVLLDKKAILPFISASIVSVPLAYFMKWLDPINFTSLVLWIFLTLRYFRYGTFPMADSWAGIIFWTFRRESFSLPLWFVASAERSIIKGNLPEDSNL